MTSEQDIQRVTAGIDLAFQRVEKKINKFILGILCGSMGYILAHILWAIIRGAL